MDAAELYKYHHQLIEDCESSDRLTEWESDFLKSIKKHLETKGSLSHRQAETLERIYGEKT